MKILAADDGAQSHASREHVHAWSTMLVENPLGFGMIDADLMLSFLKIPYHKQSLNFYNSTVPAPLGTPRNHHNIRASSLYLYFV